MIEKESQTFKTNVLCYSNLLPIRRYIIGTRTIVHSNHSTTCHTEQAHPIKYQHTETPTGGPLEVRPSYTTRHTSCTDISVRKAMHIHHDLYLLVRATLPIPIHTSLRFAWTRVDKLSFICNNSSKALKSWQCPFRPHVPHGIRDLIVCCISTSQTRWNPYAPLPVPVILSAMKEDDITSLFHNYVQSCPIKRLP